MQVTCVDWRMMELKFLTYRADKIARPIASCARNGVHANRT